MQTPQKAPVRAGVVVVALMLAACSGSDTQGEAVPVPSSQSSSPVPESGSSDTVDDSLSTAGGDATVDVQTSETVGASADAPPPETIPEVGIPGLDSADAFCQAWSRFGGSFQVVSVMASFAAETPEDAAAIEVVAAPVATAGFDAMFENWPEELAAERQVAQLEYFGPFARRSAAAYESLIAAGADDDVVAAIVTAWEEALATRDPAEPTVAVDLPDDIWAIVDSAAADLAGRFVPIPSDPSLIIDADIPETDAYLIATCPDQGTLAGQEIDGS